MSTSAAPAIARDGWTAVPRDPATFLAQNANAAEPAPFRAADLGFPDDDVLVARAREYAQAHLPRPTFHHSMRVYLFARAILLAKLPQHAGALSAATIALAALLHDIGTAPLHHATTRLSFEWVGGMVALRLLRPDAVPSPVEGDVVHASLDANSQAEAVAEAIIRHQDLGTTGSLTLLGQLLQLATIYDNTGRHRELVHDDTWKSANAAWPRLGWSGCFANTIHAENTLKPWGHTTALGERDFPDLVLGNTFGIEVEEQEAKAASKAETA